MFSCVLHTANTLTYFKCSFSQKKNIGSFESVFLHRFLKHKLSSCIFGFYNMFVKLQRVLANIPKTVKILFWGEKFYLLFTTNVWIKKSLYGWISKILLGVINPHTFLKEALIIIEDISKFKFLFHNLLVENFWNTKGKMSFQSTWNLLRFLSKINWL